MLIPRILTSFLCFTCSWAKLDIADLLPPDYDITKEPIREDGKPITVGVSYSIKGIFDVNFRDMTVLLAMYFKMRWVEPRLNLPENLTLLSPRAAVPVHSSILKKLWLPDLYIHEAVDISSFYMVKDIEGVRISKDYTIVFSSIFKTRLACPMNFAKYPFDKQTCSMTVSSYNFGEDDLRLEWMSVGASVESEVKRQVPNYNFHITTTNIVSQPFCVNCTSTPRSVGKSFLIFERLYAGHLLTMYFPSGLVVSLAWLSFFWPPEAVPGRTVLIITSLLAVVNMLGSLSQRAPETSYMKAVDVWLFICIIHVALALFQYGIVITIRRQKERSAGRIFQEKIPISRNNVVSVGLNNHEGQPYGPASTPVYSMKESSPLGIQSSGCKEEKCNPRLRQALQEYVVERIGQIGLPILFSLCCLVYWPYYLT
ncbi:gamma-aminobutyric acid receptor subunit rho-1-like [Macrobrachium rosenbergii]|uniref:gamma-aminobutyric acid receptor subunit rho-1-like n=1 Tax=Macrobrachium rosenbergii TaxID=79674 RepID=UPI0034D7AD89